MRYKDRSLLEKLVAAAAQASIFDLIKVDYVINDLSKIRSHLLEEASTVIKQKEENYARSLSLKFKRNAVFQESDLYRDRWLSVVRRILGDQRSPG